MRPLLFVPMVGLMAATSLARADSAPADVERADALFREGRARMDRGDLAAACPKLEQSFQLAPRLGTMLNLGGCFEQRGQLARALAIYERAATMARDAGRPDRERAARELAAAVEPRVAKLLLVVEESAPNLVVLADDEPVSTRGGLVPLDPGTRKITARAPGKVGFSTTSTARAGETIRVTIPRLADEAPAAVTALSPPPPSAPAQEPTTSSSPARTIGIVTAGGIALAGIGVGTYFGLRARSKWNASDAHCDASGCDPDGVSLAHEARTSGNVATVAFAVAGAGLATAGALLLFFPQSSRGTRTGTRVRLAPAGISVTTAF